MKETILCLVSGGIDSTALLYMLLTNEKYADYNIHAHHMHLRNVERRAQAEKLAIDKIFNFFEERNLREFEFTESVIETTFLRPPKFTRFLFDLDVAAVLVANMCIGDPSITKIVSGQTKTDMVFGQNIHIRRERVQKIFAAALYPNEITVVWDSPLIELTKQEVCDIFPAELRNLTWSCRTPIWYNGKPSPCGICSACQILNKMKN